MGLVGRLVPTEDPRNAATKEVPLRGAILAIGRAPRNDVVLNDPEVSKHHAEVIVGGGCVRVRDLGSSNGTFIKGDDAEPRVLHHARAELRGSGILHLGDARDFARGAAIRFRGQKLDAELDA